MSDLSNEEVTKDVSLEAPAPKKRGRKPKALTMAQADAAQETVATPKKRGPKKKADEAVADSAVSAEPKKAKPRAKTTKKPVADVSAEAGLEVKPVRKVGRPRKTEQVVESPVMNDVAQKPKPVVRARDARKKTDGIVGEPISANEKVEKLVEESPAKPRPVRSHESIEVKTEQMPQAQQQFKNKQKRPFNKQHNNQEQQKRPFSNNKQGYNNNKNQPGRQNNYNNQKGKNFNNNGGKNQQNQQNQQQYRNQKNNRPQQDSGFVMPKDLGPPQEVDGLLEITPKGFGFLRSAEADFDGFAPSVYVSGSMVREFHLRPCVWIKGIARSHSRGIILTEITSVNDVTLAQYMEFPHFDELKAVNPTSRISLETTPERHTTRTVDLVSPIARGQRGLIVAPPRTGKTTLLMHMAEAIIENYGKDSTQPIHLMVLLVDERPEEVTEFKRSLPGVEVYASSNDGRVKDHCRLAELCIERAKRLVEGGQHVFLLMDSITRLARAYNNVDKGSGRTMSGGIDAKALEMPRRLFAAARNTREAGSLTIIATALVETNSRMDDLIFQEFKGTGNMELVLNRRIAEQYIFPAVDILKSGTRRDELIMPETWMFKLRLLRRALAGIKPIDAMDRFLFFLRKYPNNAQMLLDLKQSS